MDTLMVSHVDTLHKFRMLKGQLEKARMAIFFSRETQRNLIVSPSANMLY